ncbi:hypothetical protein BHMPCIPO_06318 [Ensifer sesbaniae]|nr:hypothetical protein [Ensifer sesbaniae]
MRPSPWPAAWFRNNTARDGPILVLKGATVSTAADGVKIEKGFSNVARFNGPVLLDLIERCPPEDSGPWGSEQSLWPLPTATMNGTANWSHYDSTVSATNSLPFLC